MDNSDLQQRVAELEKQVQALTQSNTISYQIDNAFQGRGFVKARGGLGEEGQILTSNGRGLLPSFQDLFPGLTYDEDNSGGDGPVGPHLIITNHYGIITEFGLTSNGEGAYWYTTGGGSYIEVTTEDYFYVGTNNGFIQLNATNGSAPDDVVVQSTITVPTNSTTGFLIIPKVAGTPSGTPVWGAGAMIFDTSNNKLYIYNGSAWKSVTLT